MTRRYTVSGEAKENAKGVISFGKFKMTPVIDPVQHLAQVWIKTAPFTFDQFCREIEKNSLLLPGNELNLPGEQIRTCYNFLAWAGCVPKNLRMTTVFALFKGAFKLHVTGPRTLQAKRDNEGRFKVMFEYFLRSRSNEVQDSNESEPLN